MFYRMPLFNSRQSLVNLSKVHRILLEDKMIHFIYATPEDNFSFFSYTNYRYTYCFKTELISKKVYEDIQVSLAKGGYLADSDGMLK
jgi:hypothetical protein